MRIRTIRDWVVVADLGQPLTTEGGVYLPDFMENSGRYNHDEIRLGVIVSNGPGRTTAKTEKVQFLNRAKKTMQEAIRRSGFRRFIPYDGPPIGTVVMYKRNHGIKVEVEVESPWGKCWARILDQDMLMSVVEDFVPWWDVEASQVHPDQNFSN